MALANPDPAQEALGAEIRRRRRDKGVTLAQLAAEADISHPFLSQLERGYARPSMVTLERIASALGTTQVSLMLAAAPPQTSAPQEVTLPAGAALVRNEEGTALPRTGGNGEESYTRLLVRGDAAFYPQENVIRSTGFDRYYQHHQDEWVHVIEGSIEVDLGESETIELRAGDSLYYAGNIPHRWRLSHGHIARLIVVQASG
ncbi:MULTISPECIES: helix-turn-helix domain-containing protein [Gordonia]|uniref:Putative Xre family DNA-binding protein n=1 Tax=Gordonia sputi NBRC 100414 TaxID=1089453 RepID=H5U327_9ACTN|nr:MULTISPECIES: XRE family transcriptional regulator [Gordonia]NKY92993.1 helix-turn-helix domain-containing protein [Gordonia sputi]OBA41223.1 XRE family transcriptional regulator [Gordonia sp. 852002-51296_SCH5728562-b]OBA72507.1 XRE family transcriptional regulator [Gordonia sp. 852002-10350_SCH5691597]GAB40135.1 putative Xre family DNA-binding protein [Gordonia sputi NBRC 100414]